MRKIAFLLLFLLPFSFAAVAQEDKSLFLDAVALYSEGEFSAAGEMFAQLLEQKRAAYPAYRKARTEMQEYLVAQKVAAVLLEKEKEQVAMEERRKEEQRTNQHR